MSHIAEHPRVRFAPSPTGTLHVGNARTALFNYLFAQHYGGTLVLRSEDTDQERSSRESETAILNDLHWLGITWEEGPDCGGSFGPYRQSERLDQYNKALDTLLKAGKAYRCFCSHEELDRVRAGQRANKVAPHYPGTCRTLAADESATRAARGEVHVIRFRIDDPVILFEDGVRGKIRIESGNLGGDLVIRKADGFPTYNFAVVVDDSAMKISHILRGEDHLTNTAKQFLIYDALDLPRPETFHMSMILGSDKAKLSKRHGSTSLQEFRKQGYLPAALFNYLSKLGWNSGDDQEVYTPGELVDAFSWERLVKSAAIFDYNKLRWLNGQHLRKLNSDDFVEMTVTRLREIGKLPDFWARESWSERIAFLQDSIETLDNLADFWPIFSESSVEIQHKDARKILRMESMESIVTMLAELAAKGDLPDFDTLVAKGAEASGAKGRKLYQPLRLTLTGRPHGPDIHTMYAWIPEAIKHTRIQYMAEARPWQNAT